VRNFDKSAICEGVYLLRGLKETRILTVCTTILFQLMVLQVSNLSRSQLGSSSAHMTLTQAIW
jgi:hypothetical protein